MEILFIQILSFAAVFLLVVGLRAAFSPSPVGVETKPALFSAFEREVLWVGNFVQPLLHNSNPAKTAQIQQQLICGNIHVEVKEIRGMQCLACLVAALVGGALLFLATLNVGWTVLAVLILGGVGWIYPTTWLASTAQRRQDVMSRSLPFAIDLLTVAMEAGQDFTAAMRHLVSEGLKGALSDEFNVMLRQMELGKNRLDALKAMSQRIQLPEFQTLVTSVVQSTEMGSSIAATLKIQAEEIRRTRFHKAERQAARAPSLMLLPMAIFILPAVFIIIFTPVYIRVQESGMGQFLGN